MQTSHKLIGLLTAAALTAVLGLVLSQVVISLAATSGEEFMQLCEVAPRALNDLIPFLFATSVLVVFGALLFGAGRTVKTGMATVAAIGVGLLVFVTPPQTANAAPSCLYVDGSNAMTANLNMGGFNLINLDDIAINATDTLSVDGGSVIVNDASGDYDFTVETDNNTQTLVVDGGADQVRMGGNLIADTGRLLLYQMSSIAADNSPSLSWWTSGSTSVPSGAAYTETYGAYFGQTTWTGVAGGAAESIGTVSTLYILGAPIQGANITLTNLYALKVAAGNSYFGGNIDLAENDLNNVNTISYTTNVNASTPATAVVCASNARSTERCDWTADGTGDQTEINAAITAVSSTGGTVFLSEGTFSVSNAIRIKSSVHLTGQGIGATTIVHTATNINMVVNDDSVGGNTNLSISNMTLDGDGANATGDFYMVGMEKVTNVAVTNVSFVRPRNTTLWISQSTQSSAQVNTNIRVCDNIFDATGQVTTGADLLVIARTTYSVFCRNYVTGAGANALAEQFNVHAVISDNYFSDNLRSVFVETPRWITISGNHIADVKAGTNPRGIWLTTADESYPAGGYAYALDFVVRDNMLTGFNEAGAVGIDVDGTSGRVAQRGVISGNIIDTVNSIAIWLDQDVSQLLVEGNTILSATTGIELNGRAAGAISKTRLIGNRVISGTTGINLVNAAASVLVLGNDVNDNTTPVVPSLATVRDNLGYVTESTGTATVANGATTSVVNHGLNVTPVDGDCMVTATNSMGNASKSYIGTYTSTQFTITVDADPGVTTATFAWSCAVQ